MGRFQRQDINKIIIQGPIVKKFSNETAINLTIKTPKLNMPDKVKPDTLCYNYPEISFYRNTLVDDLYEEGKVVRIEGMIQKKRKKVKDTESVYYYQQIVGLLIEEAKCELEVFGYKEGHPEEPQNKVWLKGTISKIAALPQGVLTIYIRTGDNGSINNVQTFLYEKNAETYLERYQVGNRICAVGKIQTITKETQQGKKYYRNVVLSSICKE